jgi:pyruvate/2-oxoglutarate dehydrogenase complex dihydrolipoamide dehydrogenase (E3) component
MNSKKTTSSAQVSNKTQPEEFDLVILGGGTGSTVAAWTFASEGKHVAVVDRKYIGGSCPNIACLPSKNIIHRAKVASYIRRSKKFGIAHDGFTVDMAFANANGRWYAASTKCIWKTTETLEQSSS